MKKKFSFYAAIFKLTGFIALAQRKVTDDFDTLKQKPDFLLGASIISRQLLLIPIKLVLMPIARFFLGKKSTSSQNSQSDSALDHHTINAIIAGTK